MNSIESNSPPHGNQAGITERQAIQLLLIRAVEEKLPELLPPESVSGAAIAALNADSDAALLERRAAYLYDHLPKPVKGLERIALLPEDWVSFCLGATFGLGILANYLGPSGRIHVVYNPIILLILWNVGVYIALVWAWRRKFRRLGGGLTFANAPAGTTNRRAGPVGPLLPDIWLKLNLAFAGVASLRAGIGNIASVLAAFWEMHWTAAGSMLSARIKYLAHVSAIGLVTGAIAGAYLRGLFFEYNAVWESTFVHSPVVIAAFLNLIMGGAELALHGDVLGKADILPLLQESGAPAAIWIHRLSITALILVIVPRSVLLILAARRAGGDKGRLFVDLSAPYFTRTIRAAREWQTHRIRDEITTLVRLEAGRLAEGAAVLVREKFFDRLVAPTLISFRNRGGRISDLDAEIGAHSAGFEPYLTEHLNGSQRAFREALQSGIRNIVGAQLAGVPISAGVDLRGSTDTVGRELAGSVAGDFSDFIGTTVTTAVAAAAGAISGGVGKTIGTAILSTLLGTSGPVGLLIGGLGALTVGGAAYLLGRKRLTAAARNFRIPAVLARFALRDSKIEQSRRDVYVRVKNQVEDQFTAQIPRINEEILRAISASIAGRR